jgi:hypothetical protein
VGGHAPARSDRSADSLRQSQHHCLKVAKPIDFSRGSSTAREFLNRIQDEYLCMPVQWVGLLIQWGRLELG